MNLRSLISKAKAGDIAAFTELTEGYRNLAFGYAFSLLRDFQLAEDATQEAFIAAYFSLANLEEAEAFPGWLRGIVRHQVSRILRKRRSGRQNFNEVPLEDALKIASDQSPPDVQFESKEIGELVLNAINALPQSQCEVITLYYIQEFSQEAIARFLGLPVTTVNNRLHAARAKLKRRMMTMVKKRLQKQALPEEFAETVGRTIAIHGTVIDAEFDVNHLPAVLSSLAVKSEASSKGQALGLTIEVVGHLGKGLVRCIARSYSQVMRDGMEVVKTAGPAKIFDEKEDLQQAVKELDSLRKREVSGDGLLETGIKVIDLFCPFKSGNSMGIFGDMQVGKLVFIEELVRRIADRRESISLFAFIQPMEAPTVQQVSTREPNYCRGDAVQTFFLNSQPAIEPAGVEDFCLEALVYIAKAVAELGIYPAVDPLRSSSRSLVPQVVGEEHCSVARSARNLLQTYRQLQGANGNRKRLSKQQKLTLSRGRKLQFFLSQPFFVAEAYTRVPGKRTSRQETLLTCKAIIEGEYDDLPEPAFYFVGGIDEVKEKARNLNR